MLSVIIVSIVYCLYLTEVNLRVLNTIMIAVTSIRNPKHNEVTWFPVKRTLPVREQPIITQIERYDHIIVTHPRGWDHWHQHTDSDYIKEILCIGAPHRYEQEGIPTRSHRFARDINIVPHHTYLWLHGDRYSRDFGTYDNVTSVHTYSTEWDDAQVEQLCLCEPELLYTYDSETVDRLESERDWWLTTLYHTPRATPLPVWGQTHEFYPGEEEWRGMINDASGKHTSNQ